jgi:hypothetical protein
MKPTVSQLIDLLNKPALLNWANKIGLQGIGLDEYRNKSKKDGISLHTQIENFIKDGKTFENKEMQINFERYFADKKIISYEKSVETDYFKGRYDILIEYNSKKYICDFKSNQKMAYFENKLQLVAYRMAEPCDNVGIISIPDFKFIPTNIIDFNKYEEILKSLSIIYNIKKTIEHGN